MNTVILFGLDGGSFTVFDDLVRRGVMPYFGEFLRNSARGVLSSVQPPLTPPAWTTLVTGRTPGHHGVTGFYQYAAPDSLSLQLISSRQISVETVWSIVNAQGKRAGSLNFVAHQPAPKIDGWVVPGWVTWRWLKGLSHPANLIDRLKAEVPEFDLKSLAMETEKDRMAVAGAAVEGEAARQWIGAHIHRDTQWCRLLLHQLTHDPVDLAGIVFDGVDKMQHLFWPYLDPRLEPAEPRPEFLATRELCWEYYRNLDRLLEEAVATAGPDATFLICSDHGFTATREMVFINTWLEERGWLVWKDGVEASTEESLELDPPRFYELSQFDFARTKAYALTGSSNGIHIAVKGRKGDFGIPPEEYESFRKELTKALLTRCVDPATGEPLVTKVWPREEIFAGPRMGLAPDLTLQLRDHGFISVRRNARQLAPRPVIIGTHHPDGILIAHGPGVAKGAAIGPARLVDIVPTALYQMGLDIPRDLEGRVVEEIFTPEHRAARRATRRGMTKAVAAPGGAAAEAGEEEEEAEIIARMKALGYME